jgi:hypothetical protein
MMESVEIFSAIRHLPELQDALNEIAPHDVRDFVFSFQFGDE